MKSSRTLLWGALLALTLAVPVAGCGGDDDPADPVCGNGEVESGEACDDGNTTDGDGCESDCTLPGGVCGDGVLDSGEECESAADCTGTDVCNASCACEPAPVTCPDGLDCIDVTGEGAGGCVQDGGVPTGAQTGCDTTDCAAGFTCYCLDQACTGESSVCIQDCDLPPAVCGDGEIQSGETCDDGNTTAGDGCDATCQIEVPETWTCDTSYYGASDGCDCGCGAADPDCSDATAAVCDYCDACGAGSGADCGEWVVADDNSACIEFVCGDGSLDPNEECDDGNTTDDDGCQGDCTLPIVCGDGIKAPSEQCEDGNTEDGDGCAADCTWEIPQAWIDAGCNESYYGAADGCDCGCGAIDPDCADATAASCGYCDACGAGLGADCTRWVESEDNTTCIVPDCGNGVAEGTEQCDGDDLGSLADKTCADIEFGTGDVGCQETCVFDVSACMYTCGDDTRQGWEECDGTDLGDFAAYSCTDLGYTGGTLACSSCKIGGCTGGPAGWTCLPLYYDADDGCDCGCGIVDPDCTDSTAASCAYCSGPGSCGDPDAMVCPGNINSADNSKCD